MVQRVRGRQPDLRAMLGKPKPHHPAEPPVVASQVRHARCVLHEGWKNAASP